MVYKNYKILIPQSVEVALQKQLDYMLIEQNASDVAIKWLDGLMKAIESLSEFPERCPIAPENSYITKNKKNIIRHFIYKKTFRIIFMIIKNEVRVLAVRHSARTVLN